MKEILLATSNNSKIKPFVRAWENSILKNYFELVLPQNLENWSDLDISEDTGSFELDALKKAREYAKVFGMIAISLDRGFEFAALNGWPGTKTKEVLAGDEKRKLGISGFGNSDDKKNQDIQRSQELIEKLGNIKNRDIISVYGIAVSYPDGESISSEIRISGITSKELRVTNLGYFYDWFFIPEGDTRTMSEFEYDELLKFQSEVLWPIPKEIEEFLINRTK